MSAALLPLFAGPARAGRGLGRGYADFGDRVIALTSPGALRMPNGIECDAALPLGAPCAIGEGRFTAGETVVLPGPAWDPVPVPRCVPRTTSPFRPAAAALAGRGPGLTPAGDDVLAGYAAGLVLFRGARREARRLAEEAAPLTTALSATLLRHAARGELPEPAHALLERGDPGPLLAFGHTSGRALLFGLALAGRDSIGHRSRVLRQSRVDGRGPRLKTVSAG